MERTNQKIRQENRDITLLLMPLVMLLAKFIQLKVLPDKYFFDSWRMLSMLNEDGLFISWSGYQTTVDFYARINFFHFDTITEWTWFLGIVMTPVMMYLVSRTKEMEMRECLFTLMATGLLNIYVFNITKEMIQISFFFFIYVIISLPLKNTWIKLLGCAGIFYWESTFYRAYYVIMAALAVAVYFIFLWAKGQKQMTRRKVELVVLLCFVIVIVFFYLSSFFAPEDYEEALNIRDTVGNEGATTAIMNSIPVESRLGIFILDYVVNAVRMLIPIELLVKSPVYAPFFVYQILILFYFIRTIRNLRVLDDKMLLIISCFTAYFLGSVVFEPDFGSWVRHEAATFPILQLMAYQSNTYSNKETGEQAYAAAHV